MAEILFILSTSTFMGVLVMLLENYNNKLRAEQINNEPITA